MLFSPATVHVTVPHGAKPPAVDGVRYHWSRIPADQVDGQVTTALRTVIDCAGGLPFPEALAVADAARYEGFVDHRELRAAAERATGPGSAQARRVVAASTDLAENPFESALRAELLDAGVGDWACQVRIATSGGPVRVDLADAARRLVVEGDSYTHHGASRAAFSRDCRRYDELVRDGWIVLRFTWEHVVLQPGWVRDVVRDVVQRGAERSRRTAIRHGPRESAGRGVLTPR